MASNVHLGRLVLPAAISPADELGDGLEAVGAVLVAAERRPRPLELTLALRGTASDADPREAGQRLRRQITGLLENARARLEGLWLTFDADPLLDSYVMVGGGKLAIDDPSLVLGDYTLELEDLYRVGKAGTHRPARRIDYRDLRAATAWRDRKRTIYSTDFANFDRPTSVALPVGATDLMAGNESVGRAGVRTGLDGAVPFLLVDPVPVPASGEKPGAGFVLPGAVIDYAQAATDRGKGDVTIYDVRGQPSSAVAWEEAYGPEHPMNPGDVPVLANSLVRARWDATRWCVILEQPVAGVWTERARVKPYINGPTGARSATLFDTLNSASIIEWTPERAVVRVTLTASSAQLRPGRGELYITLQRGWTAPLFELYVTGQRSAKLVTTLTDNVPWFGQITNGDTGSAGSAFVNGVASDDPGTTWPTASSPGNILAPIDPPHVSAQRVDGAGAMVTVAVPDSRSVFTLTESTEALGSTRREIDLTGYVNTAYGVNEGRGAVVARIGLGAPGRLFEAETYRATGSGYTAAQVADATAFGGQAVKDTIPNPLGTNYTVSLTYAQLQALGLLTGEYDVWVRARLDQVSLGFVTASYFDALTGAVVDGTALQIFQSTGPANTYRWNRLARMEWIKERAAPADPATRYLMLRAALPANPPAGSSVMIDRVMLLPVARSKATLFAPGAMPADGPADTAAELLLEARTTATLVSR